MQNTLWPPLLRKGISQTGRAQTREAYTVDINGDQVIRVVSDATILVELGNDLKELLSNVGTYAAIRDLEGTFVTMIKCIRRDLVSLSLGEPQ